MCVIIYIPKGETISKDELKSAWNTNPDGAGYMYQTETINGEPIVKYHRGFMSFYIFYETIQNLISKYDLVLHFRITTSNCINQLQCHPYQKTNIKRLYGKTHDPVIAMNGVISDQVEYKGLNDTMSYILDNQETFKIISRTESQELIDLLETATGSRWAIMTPSNVLLSKGFIYREGKYYSNTNHLTWYNVRYYSDVYDYTKEERSYKKLIKKHLRNKLSKSSNYQLYLEVQDFIEFNCKTNNCWYCTKCFERCKTITDLKLKLQEDKYY